MPGIVTKFTLRGDDEYKQALADVNAELKLNEQQLKLVDEQYRDNAGSEEAVAARTDALTRLLDAQTKKANILKGGYADLTAGSEALQREIDAQRAKVDALTAAHGENSDEVKRARAGLSVLEEQLNKTAREMVGVETSEVRVETQTAKTRRELDAAAASLGDLSAASATAGSATADMGGAAVAAGDDFATMGGGAVGSIEDILSGLSVAAIATKLVEIGKKALEMRDKFVAAKLDVVRAANETGDSMTSLAATSAAMALSIGADMQQVASTMGAVSGSFNVSGVELEGLTSKITYLSKITGDGQDDLTDKLVRVSGLYNLSASETAALMDDLATAYSTSGASASDMLAGLIAARPEIQAYNATLGDMVALLGAAAGAGYGTDVSVPLIKDLYAGGANADQMIAAFSSGGLSGVSGSRALYETYGDLLTAAGNGKVQVDKLRDLVDQNSGSLDSLSLEASSFWDKTMRFLADFCFDLEQAYAYTPTGFLSKSINEALFPPFPNAPSQPYVINTTVNIDGKTAAQALYPYLPGEAARSDDPWSRR